MTISKSDRETLLKAQQGELDAALMYHARADTVRDDGDREISRTLAAEEGRHAAVFKGLTQQTLTPKKTKAVLLPMLYKAIGRKRVYPLIARGEYNAEKAYAPVAEKYPEVQSIKADEKRHGDTVRAFIQGLDKSKVGRIVNFGSAAMLNSTYKKVKAEADRVGIPMDEREFHCRGAFKGLHKGRPNADDLAAAAAFAKSII